MNLILEYANDIMSARLVENRLFVKREKRDKFVSWTPSVWLGKLNSNRPPRQSGPASLGELIRDDLGNWLAGFVQAVRVCSSLKAKLLGIFLGLKLAISLDITKLIMETNLQTAISLFRK